MNRSTLLALASAALLICTPAYAAAPNSSVTGKDSAGATVTMGAVSDGTLKSPSHSAVDSTGAVIDPSTSTLQTSANTKLDTVNTNLGAPGATACATDTGSCSLNQFMQRVAQRLTTLNTTLGSPFQAGGSIGNTSFGISGTLPAFASTPTVNVASATTGGATVKSIQVANNTTSVAICTAACTLYGVFVQTNSATIAYLKLYNTAQGSVTCGSGTPVDRIIIPASTNGGGAMIPIAGSVGAAYGTALTACVTTGFGDSDTTAPAASAYQISFYYK